MAKQTPQDAFDLITSFMEGAMEKNAEKNVAEEHEESAEGKDKKSTSLTDDTSVAKEMTVKNAPKNDGEVVIGRGDMAAIKKGTTDRPNIKTNDVDASNDTTASKEAMIMKMARAERLGNTVLGLLNHAVEKEAAAQTQQTVYTEIEKEALDKAAEFAYWYARGREQRMIDGMELKEAGINPALLEKVGGIDGLLDKAAEEDPASVLPPELAGAAPEAAVEGGEGDEDAALEQIAQVLSEAGITEEELSQMMQQIVAAKQAGMDDEAIMQALSEMADEGGAAGHEDSETPDEEAAEEMAKTAAVNFRSQVEMCKALFSK